MIHLYSFLHFVQLQKEFETKKKKELQVEDFAS